MLSKERGSCSSQSLPRSSYNGYLDIHQALSVHRKDISIMSSTATCQLDVLQSGVGQLGLRQEYEHRAWKSVLIATC